MGPVSLDDAPDKKRGRSRRTPAKKTASARPAKKVDAKEIEAKKSRPPRQRKTRDRANGGSAKDNNSNKPVIGMGDHVPAFMRRPARTTDGQRKA